MDQNVKELIDPHGRKIRKLRISLTDKCNLRCHYCMPIDSSFMDEKKYLPQDEMIQIIRELTEYGLEEVRLTGGEPLMRRSFSEIINELSKLELKKLSLTTNGILLGKYLENLKTNQVNHLNISLDSLNHTNFHKITNGNFLSLILKNIELAQRLNFSLKINVVLMNGVNDHELFDFVDYAKLSGIEVRFLEVMNIGEARINQKNQFISSSQIIERLKTRYELKHITKESDSTSFNFLVDNIAEIGFIASESNAFCGKCSRWRLSADGIMRACLFKNDGINLKDTTPFERQDSYQSLLGMKPILRPREVHHLMNQIGG